MSSLSIFFHLEEEAEICVHAYYGQCIERVVSALK
jgi:hypothetical protein